MCHLRFFDAVATPRHPHATRDPSHWNPCRGSHRPPSTRLAMCPPSSPSARSASIAPAERRSGCSSPTACPCGCATRTQAATFKRGAAGATSPPPWPRSGSPTTASRSRAARPSPRIWSTYADPHRLAPAPAATPGPTCAATSKPDTPTAPPPTKPTTPSTTNTARPRPPTQQTHHPTLARPTQVARAAALAVVAPQLLERGAQEAGDVHLGDAEPLGDLGLGELEAEAQGDDPLGAGIELLEPAADVEAALDLLDGVLPAAVGLEQLVLAHPRRRQPVAGAQAGDDLLLVQACPLGDAVDGRRLARLGRELGRGGLDRGGEVAAGARHVHGGGTARERAHLAERVTGGVRLERRAAARIEPVDGRQHAHHPRLLQVLPRHPRAREPPRQASHERAHLLHELRLCGVVPARRQHRQPTGRINRHASRPPRRRRRSRHP